MLFDQKKRQAGVDLHLRVAQSVGMVKFVVDVGTGI
jgi:hypothetical protein